MTVPEIQQKSNRLIAAESMKEALTFAQKLEESLSKNDVRETNPEAFRAISQEAFKLYVLTLSRLSSQKFKRIISFNILQALMIDLGQSSFIERLELKYSIYPFEYIKPSIQEEVLPLLKKNTQKIGSQSITLSSEFQNVEPTVRNWLEYYDRTTGMGKTSSFDRSKFLSNDPYVQALPNQQKGVLRELLSFYDYLQSPDLLTLSFDDNSKQKDQSLDKKSISDTPLTKRKVSSQKEPLVLKAPKPIKPNNTIDLKNNSNL